MPGLWRDSLHVTCGLTACTPGSAPGPTLGNEYGKLYLYLFAIMTKVIARVHPVHLMNVDWASGGRQPSGQASRLGLWVRRKLAAIIHIHHRHCYYYSARNLILIYRPTKGRLSWPKHCSKSAQPVLKTVYRSNCRIKHNCHRRASNLGPLTPQSDALTTRLLRPAYLWT